MLPDANYDNVQAKGGRPLPDFATILPASGHLADTSRRRQTSNYLGSIAREY
jgi:hypothetical protein